MKRILQIALAASALVALAAADSAQAVEFPSGGCGQQCAAWHGDYYYYPWGAPVALVVPPNAQYQYHMSWGVGGSRISPICPQYQLAWPGELGGEGATGFRSLPRWPSSTDQFGVYYVRGPW